MLRFVKQLENRPRAAFIAAALLLVAVIGAVDSYRYPVNFDLNIALERMVTFHGYRFALRGGIDNAWDQANPTAVYNVAGSPQYLQFLGDEGRHFVVRIRFFGRAGKK